MTLSDFIAARIQDLSDNGIVNADFTLCLDGEGNVVSSSQNTISFFIGKKYLPSETEPDASPTLNPVANE